MESLKFKTTIKCSGCVANVTPFLDEAVGKNNWEVDIDNPSKTLTVKGQVDASKIKIAVENAGYKADQV
ncbi:heavy-metal-associated domain-containing protein [uncultured Roseivirga sp.]|uniref:heavy-metal-associated domain-containing protein n=1 Tax=uncultured Roseivirga sp. TaxID=543088 RepID=UPI0030D8CFCB|tara:strand:+ start:198545 stop:198751 length:207 start_codon:yes stop_codon:yes gene_type:complete